MSAESTTLPPLREVIARHGLRAIKSLGQNFLLDLNLTLRIARAAGDLAGVTVIEVGPGPGGLTRALIAAGAGTWSRSSATSAALPRSPRSPSTIPDRLDDRRRRCAHRSTWPRLPTDRRAIVANLPYNIATPLLVGWLEPSRGRPGIDR